MKIVNGGLIENHIFDYSSSVLADWPARFMEIGLGDSCRLSIGLSWRIHVDHPARSMEFTLKAGRRLSWKIAALTKPILQEIFK
jgi:hypothetical protein